MSKFTGSKRITPRGGNRHGNSQKNLIYSILLEEVQKQLKKLKRSSLGNAIEISNPKVCPVIFYEFFIEKSENVLFLSECR